MSDKIEAWTLDRKFVDILDTGARSRIIETGVSNIADLYDFNQHLASLFVEMSSHNPRNTRRTMLSHNPQQAAQDQFARMFNVAHDAMRSKS